MAWPADDTPQTPATEADIPLPLTYTHPTNNVTVEVTGGPYIDVMRHTPYGVQTELDRATAAGSDATENAIQWAIDNQRNPDPQTRVDWQGNVTAASKGGPPGCFHPVIGGNTYNNFWRVTRPIFIPPVVGGTLSGHRINFESNTWAGPPAGGSRLMFDLASYAGGPGDGKRMPCFIVQGQNWELSDFAILGKKSSGEDNNEIGLAFCNIKPDWTSFHPYYDSDRDNTYSQEMASRLQLTRLDFNNINVGVEGGRKYDACGTWANGAHKTAKTAFAPPFTGDSITPLENWSNIKGTSTCDYLTIDDCTFINTTSGSGYAAIRPVGDQCQLWNVNRCRSQLPILFDGWAGGPYKITGGGIGNTSTDVIYNSGIRQGVNTGDIIIEDFKGDSSAQDDWKLITCDSTHGDDTYLVDIIITVRGSINSYSTSVGYPDNFIELHGSRILHLERFYGMGPIVCSGETPGSKAYYPTVLLENCRFSSQAQASDPEGTIMSGDYNDFRVMNCFWNSQNRDSDSGKATEFAADVPAATITNNYTIDVPASSVIVSQAGANLVTTLPKSDQGRTLTYDISGAPTSVSKVIGDVTEVRVLYKKARSSSTVYDKNTTDDSSVVVYDDTTGIVTVTLLAADFGDGLLVPGPNYYVVLECTIDGITGTVEVDAIQRLRFQHDQN